MGGRAGGGASGGMGSRSRGGASSGPQPMAVVKGQPGYKAAQTMAGELTSFGNISMNSGRDHFENMQDRLSRFLGAVEKKGGFGGDVAKTVNGSIKPYSKYVAKMSDKQAWAIAKSAVENGVAGPWDKTYSRS